MSRLPAPVFAALGVLLLCSGCGGEGPYRNSLLQAQTVNGQTCVVLMTRPALAGPEDQGVFRIYRSTSPDYLNWKALDDDRTGPVYGTFAFKEPDGERLGLFHPQRVSFWKLNEDKVDVETKNLPFKWIAETGVQLVDTLYLFGGKEDDRRPDEPATWRLVAACYDGKEFRELDPGPVFKPGLHGFSLQAVAHQGKILLFWRSADEGGPIDLEPPVSYIGPLRMAAFDGLSFEFEPEVRQFAGLPHGHVEVWSDGTDLKAVVQPQDTGTGRTPQLKLFTLGLSGTVREEIHVPYEAPMGLHFKYFCVTRLPGEGRTTFLRSNSQEFEVWESVSGAWRVQTQPVGLPQQQLMSLLLMVMVMCVSLVAMGVGMAIRRRRQMQWVLQRLRPQDVVAPVSLRMSAYLVDLALLVGLTHAFCTVTGIPVPRWSQIFLAFRIVPVFGLLYLLYFTLAEWQLGRTLGKWLLGIQVVTDQGDPPTLWAAFVRNLIGFFERLMVLPAIVAILLTPRAQRIGDLLSRTIVVQRAAFNRYRGERLQAQTGKQEDTSAVTKAQPPDGSAAESDGEGKS
jgi:uncharacterized RDD family membrane protein YckC